MIVQASAALRVFSSNLSYTDITEAFATQPDTFYNKGDRVSKNPSTCNLRPMSMWQISEKCSLTTDDGSMLLEYCIERLVDRIQPFNSQLRTLPNSEKDISCGLFSNNEQVNVFLSSKILLRLTSFEVDLVLSGYGST